MTRRKPTADEREAFVEVLNAYVEAEIDYRNQTGLDGMDNGGPRRVRMQTLREAVLRRYDAARSSRAGAGVTEEELSAAIYPDCEELAGPDTKADYVRVFADSIASTAIRMMGGEK